MKSNKAWFFILTLLLLTRVTFAAGKVIGQVQVAKGDVHITSAGGARKKAQFGVRIEAGDTIVTGADSRAKIVMLDKNIFNISPDSKMSFDKYDQQIGDAKETAIGLAYGKIRANVKQNYDEDRTKFRVHTKAAVAGVRGTDWLTSYRGRTNSADGATAQADSGSVARAPAQAYGPANQAEFVTFAGQVLVGLLGPDGSLTNTTDVGPGQIVALVLGNLPPGAQDMSPDAFNALNNDSQTQGGSNEYDPNAKDPEDDKGDKSDDAGSGDGDGSSDGDSSGGADGGDSGGDSGSSGGTEFDSSEVALESAANETTTTYSSSSDLPSFDTSGLGSDLTTGLDTSQLCQFCNEALQSGTANLLINVTLQN